MASSRDVMKRLGKEGWRQDRKEGSDTIFEHPDDDRIVVVPDPRKDIKTGNLRNIYRQADRDWKTR